ncbi:MAG: NAD(P)-binding domain-containing protein [Paenibacillus lautus]|jgi:3-hydroxyisobutyrate dehydrogenase-like beta-hydroxyacid dehydrogenase|uniref:NAD(P)-dependent oxidoreductase n=1 Tax=Paenibacillus lautus TaxID=1401 RepID=UPI0026E91E6F|nr:NAD(P)-binding domain-containing protein [Paenibacillus lautus]MCI1775281.1 NAD(P)-binding domain-containing protein [Paenibacillus lautus]
MNTNLKKTSHVNHHHDAKVNGFILAPVTVIGLGAMGSKLARTFVNNGHVTTVWNRTPEKAAELVGLGASGATEIADAIAASPILIICVLDYDAARHILEPIREKLSGKVVVNLTTGTPEEARTMGTWIRNHGAEYLDGGIMAVPSLIATPHAVILYSGSQTAYETYKQVLERLGTSHYLGSDPALAPLNDLALLSGMYGMFGGFIHAVALAGSEGTKAEDFTTTLLMPFLQAMISTMPEMAKQIDTGDYSAKDASLAMQAAHDTIGEVSRVQGVSAETFAPIFELMKRRVEEGYGGDDFASVIELIRKRPSS